jgi:hypothetical protein
VKPWQKQEKEVAERRGGVMNAGSGSGWRRKNDVRERGSLLRILWEMKQTDNQSIQINRGKWLSLRRNALLEGMMPAMHLQIRDVKLVVISEDDFDERFPADT